MAKRYYWLKLKEDFFSSPKIKKLRRIAGGDTYTIIYLKMQLLSVKNSGVIEFSGVENTFEEELSLVLDEDVDNISVTLRFLESQNLIESDGENSFLLKEAAECIGSEGESAERMRAFRERKKELSSHSDSNVRTSDVPLISYSQSKSNSQSESDSCNNNIYNNSDECVENKLVPAKKQDFIEGFDAFYAMYPKHVGKAAALKAWNKLKPNAELQEIMAKALMEQKQSAQWNKDGGQYIPNPATWLNQRRWEDEVKMNDTQDAMFDRLKQKAIEIDKALGNEYAGQGGFWDGIE